jgi:septal ring factor EnvC (AmiA/AmiB activator)
MTELQDSIAKITKEFENVQRMQKDAETQLAKTREEQKKAEEAFNRTTQEHGKLLADLDAKKIAADSAAAEAATRIQVNRDQTAELLRMRDDVDRREKGLATIKTAVKETAARLSSQESDLNRREQELSKHEADMARRKSKLQEALS